MHHTVAYTANVNSSGGLTQIAALTGTAEFVSNGNHVFRDDMLLFGAYAGSVLAARARLTIPSLRMVALQELRPVNTGAKPLSPVPACNFLRSPIPIRANEEIRLDMQDTTAGAARQQGGLFLFPRSAPREAIPSGPLYTIRFTGTTTLTANTWSPVALTPADVLPEGEFAIIGGDFISTGCQLGRLVLPGTYWRPGAIGSDDAADIPFDLFLPGVLGVWGRFLNTSLPQAEFLSISADTSETVNLHCIKVR